MVHLITFPLGLAVGPFKEDNLLNCKCVLLFTQLLWLVIKWQGRR